MRSRERSQALKDTDYHCSVCGGKQSTAKGKEFKLTVHHMDPGDWDGLFDDIRRRLLHNPDRLAAVCPDCHDELEKEKKDGCPKENAGHTQKPEPHDDEPF